MWGGGTIEVLGATAAASCEGRRCSKAQVDLVDWAPGGTKFFVCGVVHFNCRFRSLDYLLGVLVANESFVIATLCRQLHNRD